MNSSVFLGSLAATISFFTLFRKFRFQQHNEDSESSSLTLPSPPTSVPPIWRHHVFPSFHGPDVRRAFLSHILVVFRRKGIDPFIDNNIERSKSISPELIKAIRGSKIAIVLLSKNYASSSWCLDELAEIMKCREVLGQIVMPIFYEVDPTVIKKQMGDFGKAFRKSCKGKTKEHIERWKKALEDVATIAGEHSCKWSNEADMIEKIATNVSNMLNSSTPSRDFDGFVGMGAHMEKMVQLLCLDLDEVRMIGIWGPPGIGKTTIARVLFNKFSGKFQLSAFMVDIKACYQKPRLDEFNAQLQLQNQMLSKIIDQKDIIISHLGVAQDRLKDKKVFLVLDEVDQPGQLAALAKENQWFGPGSRIIITTEDRRVLKAHKINHIYKVKFPSSDEAFQIFCMHAFGQKHPDNGFYGLAREVTACAGGLPLGLKVLGSALRGMSKEEWEMTLPTLKTRLDGEIGSVIKFSYDALCDEDKDLFLYIACLFTDRSAHEMEEILANKFSHVRHGLHVLAEKSLISIVNDFLGERYIRMHSLLEKFGRETSYKQLFHHGLTKYQLLFNERDIREMLSDDRTDIRRFIGISLLGSTGEDFCISEKALERMSDLQFVRIYGNDYPKTLPSLIFHSQKIRSLTWEGYLDKCLPSTFDPEFLVELDMRFCKLQKLWEGTKQLKNLRFMDLTGSEDLKELPDLSAATNLEKLFLRDCSSLVELPALENATKLWLFSLRGCSNLVQLPPFIGMATNPRVLDISKHIRFLKAPFRIKDYGVSTYLNFDLSDCSSLVKLPDSIGDFTNLIDFNLSGCSSLAELPSSIGKLTSLWKLDISGCSSLVELPSSIGNLTSLEIINLSNCSSLLKLPSSIGNLQRLNKLDMCGCSKIEALPTKINLESLRTLDLTDCSQLKSFPDISTNILSLKLIGTAIKDVPLSIKAWPRLSDFHISYFESLKEFPHAHDIITRLAFRDEDIQEVPPWVKGLPELRVLRLYNCNNLVSLPQLPDSLFEIFAENCQSLGRLDCSFNRPWHLCFPKCFNLNQEARDLIMHSSTSGYAMLPGTQVPACFNHRATAGGLLTIKLNDSPLPTSLRFKACIMLVKINEETGKDMGFPRVFIDIMDKLNNIKFRSTPSSCGLDTVLTEHIYTIEFEVEEVSSTELVFQFKTDSSEWKIGECGLLQILKVPLASDMSSKFLCHFHL